MTAPRTCFLIAPIGEPGSDVRKRSDQVLRHLVQPAAARFGYDCMRADTIEEEGLITNQIIDRLLDGDLVVADLSGHNPNVYYELAVRHAAQKPVAHLIHHGEEIPFDLANVRIVGYALDDPDLLAEARENLAARIASLQDEAARPALNPISAARSIQLLQASDEPEAALMGEVLANLAALRSEVQALAHRRLQPPRRGVAAKRGMRVHHPKFGRGIVVEIDDQVVNVNFEDGGERRLMWDYAPIRIEPDDGA